MPVHKNGDNNPSLVISPPDYSIGNAEFSLYCQSCGTKGMFILEAFGLPRDAFYNNSESYKKNNSSAKNNNTKQKPLKMITYFYRDNNFKIIASIDKHIYSYDDDGYTKNKSYFQYLHDSDEKRIVNEYGYSTGLQGLKLPLYNLTEIIKNHNIDDIVYFCEGEQCVDDIQKYLGFLATTTPKGARNIKNFKSDYFDIVHGRNIVIFGDNDENGRLYETGLAEILVEVCPSVKIINSKTISEIFRATTMHKTRVKKTISISPYSFVFLITIPCCLRSTFWTTKYRFFPYFDINMKCVIFISNSVPKI